jgi:hypothetical protein
MTVEFCFSPPPQGVVGDRPDGRCPGLRALGWPAAQLHEQLVSDKLNDGAANADGVGTGGMSVSQPLFSS